MKKQILAITAAFLLSASITFANDRSTVPDPIVNELHQAFKSATNIQWKTTASFYKASFTQGNQSFDVFYAFDGTLMGVSRKITIEQLPLNLLKDTQEKGSADQVTDLFEMLTDKGTEYFITFGTG